MSQLKTAIVLGATGLTGGLLVRKLVADANFEKVILFSRKALAFKHPKIEEHIVDVLDLTAQDAKFKADMVFCCIGTTKAKTPDLDQYLEIDYGIPLQAARLAKKNNIPKFLVVSAMGANPKSRVFYNRVKGQMEQDLLQLELSETYIFRPSLITGNREEKRIGESFANVLMRIINPLIPSAYKSISADYIAKAMLIVSKSGYDKQHIPSDEIRKLGS